MASRRYHPGALRFLQRDTFADAGADLGLSLNPLTWNRYAYAASNPVGFVDPTGHDPFNPQSCTYVPPMYGLRGACIGAAVVTTIAAGAIVLVGATVEPVTQAQQQPERVFRFFHGTSRDRALERQANSYRLEVARATALNFEGNPGFYLAENFWDAYYVGRRRGHSVAVLLCAIREMALQTLRSPGALIRPLPRGAREHFGTELYMPLGAFATFNQLMNSGQIFAGPAREEDYPYPGE